MRSDVDFAYLKAAGDTLMEQTKLIAAESIRVRQWSEVLRKEMQHMKNSGTIASSVDAVPGDG